MTRNTMKRTYWYLFWIPNPSRKNSVTSVPFPCVMATNKSRTDQEEDQEKKGNLCDFLKEKRLFHFMSLFWIGFSWQAQQGLLLSKYFFYFLYKKPPQQKWYAMNSFSKWRRFHRRRLIANTCDSKKHRLKHMLTTLNRYLYWLKAILKSDFEHFQQPIVFLSHVSV